jgi:tetratricopeptide (TPR) repeat protein
MSKSLLSAVAVAAVLVLTANPVSSVAGESAEKLQVSKAASKPLKAAQDAVNAKKYDEAIAKANEALAIPGKTAFDTHIAYQMLAFANARKGNNAEAAKYMELQLDTGYATQAEQNTITKSLAAVAYTQKDYAKAIDFGNRLIKGGGGDADTYTLVAQSYYLQGKYKEAAKFLGDYINDQERRGVAPKEQSLQLLANSYEKAGDIPGSTVALEKLVTHYPKPSYWNGLLYSVMRTDGITDRQTLHVYRLMQDTKTLQQPSDYTEMAQLAIEAGTPGEAQRVLEQGFAANVFTDARVKERNTRLLEAAKKAAAADQATLAKVEAEAKNAKTGDADVALGSGFLSFGQNDKAVEALNRGVAKGGIKNLVEAQLLQGIAQLRVGQKAEAQKTFRGVKSDDVTWARLAKLWSLNAS